jgi:hypothetical protein
MAVCLKRGKCLESQVKNHKLDGFFGMENIPYGHVIISLVE